MMHDNTLDVIDKLLRDGMHLINDSLNKECKMFEYLTRRKMENPNEKPFTQMGWKVGCPATANAMLWITTKIRGKNSSLLVKGDGFCFIPMERGVATIKREEVIAFIPLMAPSPYVQLSEKSCPFCGGVGEITEDDTVTCFKCDYTVGKSVWENRL